MDGRMHYTIDRLVMLKDDKEISNEPRDYVDETGVIGDEIIAFMTAHLGDKSWRLGSSTGFGPHSLMLTMFPTIESLKFWKQAQRMKGKVLLDCGGDLEVIVRGSRLTPPRGKDLVSDIPKKDVKEDTDALSDFVKERMRRLFK